MEYPKLVLVALVLIALVLIALGVWLYRKTKVKKNRGSKYAEQPWYPGKFMNIEAGAKPHEGPPDIV